MRIDGQEVELVAHGLENIASNLHCKRDRSQNLKAGLPGVPENGLEGASGRVSLLVGQDNLRLFPVEISRLEGMALFKSQFGTGWIASGNTEKLLTPEREPEELEEEAAVLVTQETKHFQVPEFL